MTSNLVIHSVRSRGIVELILSTPGSVLEIPVILDVVDHEIPALLGLEFLYGNNLLVENVSNHLSNRIITNKDPLGLEGM